MTIHMMCNDIGGNIQHAIIKEVEKQQYENNFIDFGKWRCDVTNDLITT